jgi:hypothetical protein
MFAQSHDLVFANMEFVLLAPTMTLVAALLVGAVVVALVRRGLRNSRNPTVQVGDDLTHFRKMYERGEITEDEYKQLRGVLGGELRRAMLPTAESMPPGKKTSTKATSQNMPNQPEEPEKPPEEGIRPA